ncbi:AAA family ATPase [Paraburkholderia mimosarum]|uniref:AAA family ATPase n=1 Tax=Paraburkholderia mimosarum TaxID=312026 RepID=UPI0039C336B0
MSAYLGDDEYESAAARDAFAKEGRKRAQARANGHDAKPNGHTKPIEIWEPKVITAADLIAAPPEPIRYIVPVLLPPGLAVIAGKPKGGKSLLAADWGLATASGGSVFGREVARGGVLYLDLENSRRRIYDRYLKLHPDMGDAPNMGWILEWRRGNRAAFTQLLDDRPDVVMVIIDIWKKFCGAQPRGVEQYDFETDELQWLAKEANDRGIAIVLVMHTVKSPPLDGDPFSAISGSVAITGNADTLFLLRREGDVTKLYQRGRDSGDASYVLRMGDDLRFRYVCEGDQVASDEQMKYLIAIHRGDRMPTELSKAIGVSRQAVWQMVKRLQESGYLTLPGGIPSLTPIARQMVEAMSKPL